MKGSVKEIVFVKKTIVYFEEQLYTEKGLLDTFDPVTIPSINYKHWLATLDIKTCKECRSRHGHVYQIDEPVTPEPPLHVNCRCKIIPMESIKAGNATKNGNNGADYRFKYFGELPEYYVSEDELVAIGWSHGKKPSKFAPGKMYYKGIYKNSDEHLPTAPGRIWYEADINYYEGRRNRHRVLWSNDGLMFVTYDHYETFYEII